MFRGAKQQELLAPSFRFFGCRIDPANIAVVAAVNNVDLSVARIAKYNECQVGKIHLHHGVTDTHFMHHGRRFGDNEGIFLLALALLVTFLARLHDI